MLAISITAVILIISVFLLQHSQTALQVGHRLEKNIIALTFCRYVALTVFIVGWPKIVSLFNRHSRLNLDTVTYLSNIRWYFLGFMN